MINEDRIKERNELAKQLLLINPSMDPDTIIFSVDKLMVNMYGKDWDVVGDGREMNNVRYMIMPERDMLNNYSLSLTIDEARTKCSTIDRGEKLVLVKVEW